MEPSVAPPPSDLVPTRPRTENPAVITGPTNPPAGSNEGGQCTPDSAGLFGSQLGFAEEYEYSYEITTIPSVTAEDVNLFVLPNVEMALSQGVLKELFESCNPDTQTSVNRSPTQTSAPVPAPLSGYVLVGDSYVYQHGRTSTTTTERSAIQSESYQKIRGRRRRMTTRELQFAGPPQQIEGVSTQPADRVVEGEECVTQNVANLNCFVIRGTMTTYSREKQTDETQDYIQDVIDTTLIETTNDLQDSDNRIVDLDYRDTERYPLPPAGAPDDDEVPTPDDDVVMNEPTQSPVQRPDSRSNEFGEPWHYALIAVGVCLIAATIYLCVRRPYNLRYIMSSSEDDDEKEFDESSVSEEESNGDFHREAAAALAATNLAFGEQSDSLLSASASKSRPPNQANAFGVPDGDDQNDTEAGDDGDEEEEVSYEIEVSPDADGSENEEEQSLSTEEVLGVEEEESYELEEEVDVVDEEEFSPEEDFSAEEDEEMDDDGEWVVEDDFEDEPTYDERLNDETSAEAAAVMAASQGFEQASFPQAATPRQSYEVESTKNSPVQPKESSATSFSAAIARAMNHAAGEKSETDFSPFDQIHDDNIYGATTGEGTEYEFRQTMPMNSSHHADSSGVASSEFEEVSVEEDEYDDESYEIEYATESSGDEFEEDEFEEDYVSEGDEEEESYGSSYESR